jgi:hypothetical protein
MESLECEFCEKTFSSKQNLNTHKKTAKYCLDKRGIQIPRINCDYCDTSFTVKSHLQTHLGTCQGFVRFEYEQKFKELKEQLRLKNKKNKKLNIIIEDKQQIIQTLTDKVHKLELELEREKGYIIGMEKPRPPQTITTNTQTNYNQKILKIKTDNIKPFSLRSTLANPSDPRPSVAKRCVTIDLVKENLPKYDLDAFAGGIPRLIKFISDMIVLETKEGKERNYVCTDISRDNFHRLLKEGGNTEWTSDKKALFLNNVFDELKSIFDDHVARSARHSRSDVWTKLNDVATERNNKYGLESINDVRDMYLGIKAAHGNKRRTDLVSQVTHRFATGGRGSEGFASVDQREKEGGVKSVASI